MVDTGTIEFKLKNYCKHLVCRKIKVFPVEKIDNNFSVKITTPFGELNFMAPTRGFKVKDFIHAVSLNPAFIPLTTVNVTETSLIGKEVLKNFPTIENIPDSFTIKKLPYRQLKIETGEKSFFLPLSVKTYQKLLSFFSNIKTWPCNITFSQISNYFTRRELVPLFLYLSQDS